MQNAQGIGVSGLSCTQFALLDCDAHCQTLKCSLQLEMRNSGIQVKSIFKCNNASFESTMNRNIYFGGGPLFLASDTYGLEQMSMRNSKM
jgi:hypothetical protein